VIAVRSSIDVRYTSTVVVVVVRQLPCMYETTHLERLSPERDFVLSFDLSLVLYPVATSFREAHTQAHLGSVRCARARAPRAACMPRARAAAGPRARARGTVALLERSFDRSIMASLSLRVLRLDDRRRVASLAAAAEAGVALLRRRGARSWSR